MLKKAILTLVVVTLLTGFYGENTRSERLSVRPDAELPLLLSSSECRISVYDDMIHYISSHEGYDWRFVSAIVYHESRFKSEIVSPRGACGLMQVMPAVASQFDIPEEYMADPQINIWLGTRILGKIVEGLHLSASISRHDYMSLVLASYNGGIGHVNDARRLARVYGENPDSWEVVARYLTLEALPEYYNHSVVQSGRFTGAGQTRAFVHDVMQRYEHYCRVAEL